MKQATDRVFFTKEMKKTHTILIPMMLPIHFSMLKNLLYDEGYNVELLTNVGPKVVETGLKYVHNDTCYPATLCVGQFVDALNSGKYDLNKVAQYCLSIIYRLPIGISFRAITSCNAAYKASPSQD